MTKEGYQPIKTKKTTKIILPNTGSHVQMKKDGYTWEDLDRSYWEGFDNAKNKMQKRIAEQEELLNSTLEENKDIYKKMADLDTALEDCTESLTDARIKIKKLEKENEELKERADKADLDSVTFFNQLCKAKEIIKDLSKSLFLAKGIVRDLIDDTVDFKESKERAIYCYEREKFDIYKQAEQFLRESE